MFTMSSRMLCFLFVPLIALGEIRRPPLGWNSWISYKSCINESEFLLNLEAFDSLLVPFGYSYLVIDGGWSRDPGSDETEHIDQYGRPQPSPIKFPHSSNGTGFVWLAEQVHAKGLKFGLWVGRGIHELAIDQNTPILGTTNPVIYAKQIVNQSEQCGSKDFYGVKSNHNGSQQFIYSLYSQFKEWGVDFIKNDCSFGNKLIADQVNYVFNAMDQVYDESNNKSEFVYSLSPGREQYPPSHYNNMSYWSSHSSMYRITSDCWDEWSKDILTHFNVSAQFASAGFIGSNGRDAGLSFPDLDMLALGFINNGNENANHGICGPYKYSDLSPSQQRVTFTLWSISRSPLIFGGSVKDLFNDKFTLDLITNQIALNVNQNSSRNREISSVYDKNGNPMNVTWSADGVVVDNNDFYVAFFNVDLKSNKKIEFTLSFQQIFDDHYNYTQCKYVEAWTNDTGIFQNSIIQYSVKSNDTALLYLNDCT
eukprot:141051_1